MRKDYLRTVVKYKIYKYIILITEERVKNRVDGIPEYIVYDHPLKVMVYSKPFI